MTIGIRISGIAKWKEGVVVGHSGETAGAKTIVIERRFDQRIQDFALTMFIAGWVCGLQNHSNSPMLDVAISRGEGVGQLRGVAYRSIFLAVETGDPKNCRGCGPSKSV